MLKGAYTYHVPKDSEGVWIILYSSPYKLKTALGRRVGGGEVKRLFIEGYKSARTTRLGARREEGGMLIVFPFLSMKFQFMKEKLLTYPLNGYRGQFDQTRASLPLPPSGGIAPS